MSNYTVDQGKGSLQNQESHLVSDPPPSYSEIGCTIPNGPSKTGQLEDEVVVSLLEVEQTLTINAPHLNLTPAQKETIKRLSESLLKQNVREQGVLPTTLQKQFALEHVVSKFDKTPRTGDRNNSGPVAPSHSSVSSSFVTFSTTNAQSNIQTVPVISAPTFGDRSASTRGGRTIIGTWLTYTVNNGPIQTAYAYDDQVPRTIKCLSLFMVIFFFIGSPLSLFCTVPAIYWTCMVIF